MKMGSRKRGGGGGPSLTVFERVLRCHIESCKTKHATLDDVVGYLRSTFPEYGRHKLQPFTKSVQRTLQPMKSNNNLRSSSQCRPSTSGLVIDNGEDYEMDDQQSARKKMKRVDASEERLQRLEDQHIQRNRKSIDKSTSSSSESNSTEETDGAVPMSEDSVYGEEFEPEFDLMKLMLHASYSDSKAASKLKKKAVEEKDKVEKNVELEEVFRNKVATRKVEPIGGGDVEEEVKGRDGPRFKDLGGMGGVLEELKMEVIVPLFHPQLPRWLGVRPMAGILLHGPPGCGKTKLAHAVANETGVPFYKISATELVCGVSGGSEENIRDHFAKAYRTAPSIVFIDEIDAIASKRENLQREMERRIGFILGFLIIDGSIS